MAEKRPTQKVWILTGKYQRKHDKAADPQEKELCAIMSDFEMILIDHNDMQIAPCCSLRQGWVAMYHRGYRGAGTPRCMNML